MKKLLIASAILFSGLVAGPSGFASAAVLDPIIWDGTNAMPNSLPAAVAVDTFTFTNSNGPIVMLVNATGGVKVGAQTCNPHDCYVGQMVTSTFEVVSPGTIQVQAANGTVLGTITLGSGGGMSSSGPATVVKGSFDPNGGECIFDGQKQTAKYSAFTIGFWYAPGVAECTRKGYVFTDWLVSSTSKSAGLPVLVHEPDMVRRHFVAQSGDYVAKWEKATSFDLGGGSCLIDGAVRTAWFDILTDGQGRSRATNEFVRLPSPDFCTREGFTLSGWTVDGVKSSFGEIAAGVGATYVANWDTNTPTITIIGSRGSVDASLPIGATCASYVAGPPQRTLPAACVVVEGLTTGLAAGTEVTPEYRFPGQTSYTTGIPIKVDSNGEFTWYRKTGKKIYVRFLVGDVVSNRVIIPAK